MKIIAHRGFWLTENEKNSQSAFERAISNGFGIETDVRDANGQIVIAHDAFTSNSQDFLGFFEAVKNTNLTFAINVKADGLSKKFAEILNGTHTASFVFFDMSGPEHSKYIHQKLPVLNRISEYEEKFTFPGTSPDIWLDAFSSESWVIEWLSKQPQKSKKIFVVSPELHGREHIPFWNELLLISDFHEILLCTDYPDKAKTFFGGQID